MRYVVNGYLEFAKWLWSLDQKIDIHTEDEYVFRASCGAMIMEFRSKYLYSCR